MDHLDQSSGGFVIIAMSRMHLELIGSQKFLLRGNLQQMLATILGQVRVNFGLSKMIKQPSGYGLS